MRHIRRCLPHVCLPKMSRAPAGMRKRQSGKPSAPQACAELITRAHERSKTLMDNGDRGRSQSRCKDEVIESERIVFEYSSTCRTFHMDTTDSSPMSTATFRGHSPPPSFLLPHTHLLLSLLLSFTSPSDKAVLLFPLSPLLFPLSRTVPYILRTSSGITLNSCATSGLRWESIPSAPDPGRPLINTGLANALASKTVFLQEEWNALKVEFGIPDLYEDNFVVVGTKYFKPKGTCPCRSVCAKERQVKTANWAGCPCAQTDEGCARKMCVKSSDFFSEGGIEHKLREYGAQDVRICFTDNCNE